MAAIATLSRPARADVTATTGRRLRFSEGRMTFAVSATAYLVLAAVLVFHFHLLRGRRRLPGGQRLLHGVQPGSEARRRRVCLDPPPFAAPGAVRALHLLWAPLTTVGFLGNIESALAMAGAVTVGLGILRDLGLSRGPRLLLTAIFALQPMILEYGANGMSEALEILTILLVVRALLRWFEDRSHLRPGPRRRLPGSGLPHPLRGARRRVRGDRRGRRGQLGPGRSGQRSDPRRHPRGPVPSAPGTWRRPTWRWWRHRSSPQWGHGRCSAGPSSGIPSRRCRRVTATAPRSAPRPTPSPA